MSIKTKDESNVPDVIRVMQILSRKQIQIGIFATKPSYIYMVAVVNEYGVDIQVTPKMRAWFAAQGKPLSKATDKIHVPERSYIRSGFDKYKKNIMEFVQKQSERAIALQITPEQYFSSVGEYASGLIKKYLTELKDPPNAQMTIERKGSDNPLIDEGRLRNSITWRAV